MAGEVMGWLDMEERGLRKWDADRDGVGGQVEERGSNRR